MKLTSNLKILIVGLGLIGGSYATALKKKGFYVSAITKNQEDIDYAVNKGIIDRGSSEVNEELIKEADIITIVI